ncbi:MAG: calcium-binding protein [Cyanobacteria bacterium P01_D01_bin.1]
MAQSSIDEKREHRITYEVVVDCYDEYEIAMGWYYYLLDNLSFPLEARWTDAKSLQASSKQKSSKVDTVQIIGMADGDDCQTDMLVKIEYSEGSQTDVIAVPLSELQLVEGDDESIQAYEDWQYWLDQGNRLVDPDEDEEY